MISLVTWFKSAGNFGLDTWIFRLELSDGATVDTRAYLSRAESEAMYQRFTEVTVVDTP